MIQYKLIKEYPGSPKLGTIEFNNYNITEPYVRHSSEWKGTIFYDAHPEFWQKLEEFGYEILSFFNKMNKRVYHFNKASKSFCSIDGFHNNVNYEYCLEYYVITSVKRLSDGEVFTIGDRVKSKIGTDDDSSLITKIYINTNKDAKPVGGLIIQTGGYYQAKINEITKVKTPLFTTEDGVAIFEGDSYVCVTNQFELYEGKKQISVRDIPVKSFSTKEEAEKWVLFNKPCLSINEIGVNLPEGNLLQLLKIVKSKL